MRARWSLVPVVVLAGSVGARPAAAARSWTEVRSPSFTVVTDGSEKDGRRVATQFETIRAYLQAIWPWASFDPHQPVTILAVRDEDGLKALLPAFWEEEGRARPAGVFVTAPNRNWVALRTDVADLRKSEDDWHNPYLIVFHEYVHLVLGLNFAELPAWFDEGLAEFWGNTVIEDGRIDEGRHVEYHLEVLRKLTPINVVQLFAVKRDSPRYSEENKATIFYAESWALVHYLVLGSEERQGQLNRFATLLHEGMPASRAATEAFGNLVALDRELRAYIRNVAFHYRRRAAGIDVDAADFVVRPLPEAESLGLRAGFHVATGRSSEARALAAEALRLDPGSGPAHEALALLAWKEGETKTALDALTRALERPDASSFAHFLCGQLRWQAVAAADGSLAEVEASFRRAVELSPTFADAYEALARVRAERGAPLAETLPLAVKAALLDPGEIGHSLTALRLAARAGGIEEARTRAERLLANTTDDGDRARVQVFLTELTRWEAADRLQAQVRDGVDPDPGDVFRFLEGVCAGGNVEACAHLASMLRQGVGVPKDEARAESVLDDVCSKGSARACGELGLLYAARSTPGSLRRAAASFEKGCEGGSARSCAMLASLVQAGQGVDRDPARVRSLFRRACEGGYGEACAKVDAAP